MDAVFTLVRQLATRSPVTEVAAPKWLVHRHGLAPLVARAGQAAYRDVLVRAMVEWGRIQQDLPLIVNALHSAGVRVCALKGLSYATWLYETPAERPMSDIDLLVPAADAARARDALRGIGFVPFQHGAVLHHAAAFSRGGLALDLHWNIIGPGRARIDLDAVWSRTSGNELGHLEPTDALAFHLIHLARNRLRLPLINIVDASRLLARASREEALARSRSWGLGHSVELALTFYDDILAGRTPASVSREDIALVRQGGVGEKLRYDVTTAGSPRQIASRIVQLGTNSLRALVSSR